MKELNRYRNTSHYYDLDDRPIVKDDIPFYLEYARRMNGEILELACGTGRVTIPLAQAGYSVTGIDLSADMLDRLEEKLEREHKDVQERITVLQADMSNFSCDRSFPLIMIPFRAFQLLTDKEQQRDCLKNVREHLTDDGLFIVHVFMPYQTLDESWVQPEKEDWVKLDPASGCEIRRTNIKRSIDLQNQITYPALIYDVKTPDGQVSTYEEQLVMAYFYDHQLRELLMSEGFNIVNEYGLF